MHIAIVYQGMIPAVKYGGTQRVLWYLGQELVRLGHKVTYLVGEGSHCDFAEVRIIDISRPIDGQLPDDVDLAHVCYIDGKETEGLEIPFLVHMHSNFYDDREYPLDTVFISRNHAARHGSDVFVHNGLNWDDYGQLDTTKKRDAFHFLGKASWSVKNVKGAIDVTHKIKGARLDVLGGVRFNISQGIRLTFSPRIRFHGMVGGEGKNHLVNRSKGLIFPVIWDEPFGLAIIESLYYGCPVFGTPYGSLPELVGSDFGFLSNSSDELAEAARGADSYSRAKCHEYARDTYNSRIMAEKFVALYGKILSGERLHDTPPRLKPDHRTRKLPWN